MFKIVMMGPAGSGKGTQSNLISQRYGLPEISTGTLLRNKVKDGDELGQKIDKIISSGDVVSDDLVFSILKEKLESCKNGFILDGFPRNINQAIELDEYLGSDGITHVLVLDVPEDIVIKRISGRFECKKCRKVYNRFFNNTKIEGVCDVCGSTDFSVRSDDENLKAIEKRLAIYNDMSKNIIEYYSKKNLIYFINGLKSIESISEDIENILVNNINKE